MAVFVQADEVLELFERGQVGGHAPYVARGDARFKGFGGW
jgi:hypothetical protein